MTRHLFIITGTSRGLGAAMAVRLAAPEHRLLCIARGRNDALAPDVEQMSLDLANPIKAGAALETWLQARAPDDFDSATLINNAATLTRIGHLDDQTAEELTQSLRVGLGSPLVLMAAFLRVTRPWRATRKVLNISSGLGRRAMAGEAAYCAVKAGLDHATRSIALDEATQPNAAKLVSLAPGVIDTAMQDQLRAGDPASFPDHARFVALKVNGQLTSAEDAAARVLAYLGRDDYGSEPVADVRDA